ncbi:MAG TPA: hypothetical protein VE307_05790 [Nitrososphaeraceae archaeon]|nr:hypothetical protein [Nitrososphaeraceae archaeon]
MISFILDLKVIKSLLFFFLLGCFLRIIPDLMAYPYPVGYDIINYYIPLADKLNTIFQNDSFQFYPYLLYTFKSFIPLNPQGLMISLSSITYGLFSVSIYLLLKGLNLKPTLFMTVFILFQISALRTTWDLQKDILALSFTFLIIYLILEDRKAYFFNIRIIHFGIIISLVILTLLTDNMIGFLLIISLSIYFAIKKDIKYIISLTIIIISIISFLVVVDNTKNDSLINSINHILTGNIKENENYTPLNLGILFIMMNILSLPLFIYGLKYLHELLLYIPLSMALLGSFTWIVLPYSAILLPDRWIIISGIFMSIFSSYGLIRLFSNYKDKPNYKILLPIMSFYIIIGLFYMILPYDYAFPIYGIFAEYTHFFVPSTMQFNSIDIVDNKDLSIAIDWLNNHTNPKSIIYGDSYLSGWMKMLLKDKRIFQYNYTKSTNNGIHITLANKIDSINEPIKLLFSQGNFRIIEK